MSVINSMDFSDLGGGLDEKQSQAQSSIKAQGGEKTAVIVGMCLNDFNSL